MNLGMSSNSTSKKHTKKDYGKMRSHASKLPKQGDLRAAKDMDGGVGNQD